MFFLCLTLSIIAVILFPKVDSRRPSTLLSTSVISLLVILPIIQFLPKIQVDFLPTLTHSYTSLSATSSAAEFHWTTVLTVFWLSGSCALLIRLLVQALELRQLVKRSTPVHLALLNTCSEHFQISTLPVIRSSSELQSPVICGIFSPTILLPIHAKHWSSSTLEMVILHELSHLKRKDLWVISLANLCCAIHWYNPLVWRLKKRFTSQCEYACDATVLSTGTDKKTYINALCDVAQQLTKVPANALSMADKATLRNRVDSMVRGTKPQRPVVMISLIIVTSTSALALTFLRPRPIDPTPAKTSYTDAEIKLRLSANPFPQN